MPKKEEEKTKKDYTEIPNTKRQLNKYKYKNTQTFNKKTRHRNLH